MKKVNVSLLILGPVLFIFGLVSIVLEIRFFGSPLRFLFEWGLLGIGFMMLGVYAFLVGLSVIKRIRCIPGIAFILLFLCIGFYTYISFLTLLDYSGVKLLFAVERLLRYLVLFVGLIFGIIAAWSRKEKYLPYLILAGVSAAFGLVELVSTLSFDLYSICDVLVYVILGLVMLFVSKKLKNSGKRKEGKSLEDSLKANNA